MLPLKFARPVHGSEGLFRTLSPSRCRHNEKRPARAPREFDKLLIYMVADVALKRKAKGLKLNYPEAVGVISAVALDGARAGKRSKA
jgi:hypothetical protein